MRLPGSRQQPRVHFLPVARPPRTGAPSPRDRRASAALCQPPLKMKRFYARGPRTQTSFLRRTGRERNSTHSRNKTGTGNNTVCRSCVGPGGSRRRMQCRSFRETVGINSIRSQPSRCRKEGRYILRFVTTGQKRAEENCVPRCTSEE